MKIFILFILLGLGLISCETVGISEAKTDGTKIYGTSILTREYQECEYIYILDGYTHKGNCKNSIHKCPCK